MKSLLLLCLLATSLRAVTDNSVTIYDASGGSPTSNAVHSMLLTFPDDATDGLADCAQPVISGTPLTDYQNTVRRRYTSGRLHQTYISFIASVGANSSVAVSFQNSATCNSTGGLTQSEMLSYLSGAWSAQIKATANPQGTSTQAIIDAQTMITAGHWSYISQGPVMTEVLVEAPNATPFTYDFGWKNRRNTALTATVSTSAKSATVVDAAEIATLVASSPTIVIMDSEHISVCQVSGNTLYFGTSGDCPSGVGSTSGRAQDSTTLASHISHTSVAASSITSEWIDAPSAAYKSLHPYFVLQFWNRNGSPYSGVRIEAVIENAWKTKLQDQPYTLELWGGSTAAKVYPSSGTKTFTQIAGTSVRKVIWSGTAPGLTRIDHNFTWLKTVKAVPHYDAAKSYVPTSWYTSFSASDKGDIMGHGVWNQDYDSNTEGALLQTEEVLFLQNMGDTCASGSSNCAKVNDILFGESVEGGGGATAVEGYLPLHYRESNSGGKYYCPSLNCAAGEAVDGLGMILSRDDDNTQYTGFGNISFVPQPIGVITKNGWTSTSSPFISHLQEHASLAYLLTGAYWHYRELLYTAHAGMFVQSNTAASVKKWGWIKPSGFGNLRGETWNLYQMGLAASMAWDSTPEQSYFAERTANHLAIAEGVFNITDGAYPPSNSSCPGYLESSTTDAWCFGKNSGTGLTISGSNVLGTWPNPTTGAGVYLDAAVVNRTAFAFQHWFYTLTLGRLGELGFGTQPLATKTMLPTTALILAKNPYLANTDYPATNSSDAWFSDINSWYLGFSATSRAVASFTDAQVSGANFTCGGHSYQFSLAAALAVNYARIPSLSGTDYPVSDAFDWWDANSIKCSTNNPTVADNVPARWTISPQPVVIDPLLVTTASLPNGTRNSAYSQTLGKSGGTAPYTWAITGGSLCTGLSLDSDGNITGTPTVIQTCSFTVTVTDGDTTTADRDLSITILSTFTGSEIRGTVKIRGTAKKR